MATNNSISDIIHQKLNRESFTKKVGLLDGISGESLYYFYRSELLDEEASYDKAVAKLHKVIEAISIDPSHSTFHNGIAGVGWLILHLNSAGIVEVAIEDFLDSSVDEFLYKDMIKHCDAGIYDFFFGASGICFYFLKRYISTENHILKETYKTYITHFLFYIEYISVTDANGVYWKHHQYPFEDDGVHYQLSAKTNISGLMMVLVEIAKTNNYNPVCIPLLEKSSNWMLHQLETNESPRIDQAFCLWKTANVLNNDILKVKAIQFLKHTAESLSEENSISLNKFALIYQKMAQQTEDAFFLEKAKKCFQILENRLLEEELEDQSIWKGYAGMALTDLSLKYDFNTDWTHCMLI